MVNAVNTTKCKLFWVYSVGVTSIGATHVHIHWSDFAASLLGLILALWVESTDSETYSLHRSLSDCIVNVFKSECTTTLRICVFVDVWSLCMSGSICVCMHACVFTFSLHINNTHTLPTHPPHTTHLHLHTHTHTHTHSHYLSTHLHMREMHTCTPTHTQPTHPYTHYPHMYVHIYIQCTQSLP